MFTVEERDRARDRILAIARADRRIVAGAAIGSAAHGPGDRWSDLDLGFGVGEVFGDRRWDGPVLGPVLDRSWVEGVNAEAMWTALN